MWCYFEKLTKHAEHEVKTTLTLLQKRWRILGYICQKKTRNCWRVLRPEPQQHFLNLSVFHWKIDKYDGFSRPQLRHRIFLSINFLSSSVLGPNSKGQSFFFLDKDAKCSVASECSLHFAFCCRFTSFFFNVLVCTNSSTNDYNPRPLSGEISNINCFWGQTTYFSA